MWLLFTVQDSIGQFFYLPGSPENLLNSKKRLRYVNKPQAIATENVRNPITGNGVELPEHRPAIERRKDAVVSPITGQVTARAEFVKPIVTRVSRRRVLQWGIRNRMMDDGGVYIGEPAMIERKHDSVVSPITGSGVSGGRDEEQLPFGTPLPITHCRRRPCLSSQNSPRVNTITGQIMSDGDIESRPNDDDDDSDGDEVEDDDDENAAAT